MGRLGWVLAAGAAAIGGMIYHDRVGFDIGGDKDRVVIVDGREVRAGEIDREDARAITAAVGRLVKAEVRLAKTDAMGGSEAELAAARAERDRAQADIDRLEARIEAQRTGDEKHKTRDQIREEIRAEIREAMR